MEFNFHVPHPPGSDVRQVTSQEVERILLAQLAQAQDDPAQALWNLAQFYKRSGKLGRATEILRDLLARTSDPEPRAQIVLTLGQAAEQASDYELAVHFYREALVMEPCDPMHWYLIHNNLGFSLNKLGQFAQGEEYCRRAIAIDPARPNAHKNLGLALCGQMRNKEAADAFVRATMADAADDRAFQHLEKLLAEHPDLEPEFAAPLRACRNAVQAAKEATATVWEDWHKGRQKSK